MSCSGSLDEEFSLVVKLKFFPPFPPVKPQRLNTTMDQPSVEKKCHAVGGIILTGI